MTRGARARAWLCAACVLLACARAASPSSSAPHVLACFWGLDRAADVTFPSFQKHVLNVLNADLAGALPKTHADGSGAWHAAAKYLDLYDEPRSYDGVATPRAVALARNSSLHHIRRDNFLEPTGLQQLYSKARLWALLEATGALDAYDWFFLARTDLHWVAPVADFRGDASRAAWVPYAGVKNDWQGYYDRALAVHRSHLRRVLLQLEAVSTEGHPFLDALRGYPGGTGPSTNVESFYRQYLEFYSIPVRRFPATAFVTATTQSYSRLRIAQANNDTGHTYKYTDEYVAAMNNALAHYRALRAGAGARGEADDVAAANSLAVHDEGRGHDTRGRRFYVITIEEAERANRTLRNCALSAWGMAVYERLLSHPLRTKHVAAAHVAFAPPHGAWDFHWPFFNGNRERNAARRDAHFPLPEEGAGYEPYGASLATSCRTHFAPCGYEGCLPAFGARRLRELLDSGEALSPEGLLAVLEKLYRKLNLAPGKQRLVFYDSGAAGPVAYFANRSTPGGYDLPARAYADDRFVFALATSVAPLFRPGRDVSLPTPWTEDVRRYGARTAANRTYLLTFKGTFATAHAAGDVRARARAALHNPARGVVIVDAASEEGASYDYRLLMYDTLFALILRGDQPYSYRYTEVVCSGSVPVMLSSDGWVTPFSSLHPFTDYGILVTDAELPGLVVRLRAMPEVEIERLRYAAKQFCMQHLITPHAQTDSMIEAVLGAP